MLVNLHAESFDKLSLPCINFKPGQIICVAEIFVSFKRVAEDKDSGMYLLTSTLIDKSPTNLKQELLFLTKNHKHFLHFTPAQKKYYKIQCLDFQSSQFNLIDCETEEKIENIKYIYFQLEVIDGIQQNIKKT